MKIAATALRSTMMTPIEHQMGRFMRAPDHFGAPDGFIPNGSVPPPPPPSPTPSLNNQSGNSGAEGSDSSGANNTGDDFDPASFWGSDDDEGTNGSGTGNGSQSSAPPPPPPSSTPPTQSGGFVAEILGGIEKIDFGGDFFTPDAVEKINNGDFKDVNAAMNQRLRSAVTEGLKANVQVLKHFQQGLVTQVQTMIDGALGKQKDGDFLTDSIPAAKNPKVAPGIKAIYEHALTKTKGNRERAVHMTKMMLRAMAGETADDLDLSVAPRDPHASQPAPSTDWLEELTAR